MDSKAFKVFTAGSSGQPYYVSLCTVRILRVCKQNGRPSEMPLHSNRQKLLSICTWLVQDRYLYTSACQFPVIISFRQPVYSAKMFKSPKTLTDIQTDESHHLTPLCHCTWGNNHTYCTSAVGLSNSTTLWVTRHHSSGKTTL